MICPHCKANVKVQGKFCPKCGEQVLGKPVARSHRWEDIDRARWEQQIVADVVQRTGLPEEAVIGALVAREWDVEGTVQVLCEATGSPDDAAPGTLRDRFHARLLWSWPAVAGMILGLLALCCLPVFAIALDHALDRTPGWSYSDRWDIARFALMPWLVLSAVTATLGGSLGGVAVARGDRRHGLLVLVVSMSCGIVALGGMLLLLQQTAPHP